MEQQIERSSKDLQVRKAFKGRKGMGQGNHKQTMMTKKKIVSGKVTFLWGKVGVYLMDYPGSLSH